MMEAREHWQVFKVPEEETYQPEILLLVIIFLMEEGERKLLLKDRISPQQTCSAKTCERTPSSLETSGMKEKKQKRRISASI